MNGKVARTENGASGAGCSGDIWGWLRPFLEVSQPTSSRERSNYIDISAILCLNVYTIMKYHVKSTLIKYLLVHTDGEFDQKLTSRVQRQIQVERLKTQLSARISSRLDLEKRWWTRKYRELEHAIYLAITQHKLTQ